MFIVIHANRFWWNSLHFLSPTNLKRAHINLQTAVLQDSSADGINMQVIAFPPMPWKHNNLSRLAYTRSQMRLQAFLRPFRQQSHSAPKTVATLKKDIPESFSPSHTIPHISSHPANPASLPAYKPRQSGTLNTREWIIQPCVSYANSEDPKPYGRQPTVAYNRHIFGALLTHTSTTLRETGC